MSQESIARTLEALLELHRRDQDGGDRLVRAVVHHAGGLASPERGELDRHLLALVDAEDPRVWRIALEAIVRMGTATTAGSLVSLLAHGERSAEWSDAVVLALLRLGSADAVERTRAWVREELRLLHPGALPMLAWLYRVDREEALAMGARFYADVLGGAEPVAERLLGALRGQLPGQLEGLLAHSTSTALDLVDRVAALSPPAGRALAALMVGYLSETEAAARLGRRAVNALGGAMRMRAS